MDTSITASHLKSALAGAQPPLLIDVRRTPAFRAAPDMAAGALRRDPAQVASWAKELPRASSVVVYCVHGHEVSQNAAKALRDMGIAARFLEGGLDEGWKAGGGEVMAKPKESSTRWVTRERPKIDRIACPVAGGTLRGSRGGVPLRAEPGSAAHGEREGGDTL